MTFSRFLSISTVSLGALFAAAPVWGQKAIEEHWAPDRPNAIAAKVEGQIITFEQVRQEMAPLLSSVYRSSATEEDLQRNIQRLQRDVLQNLIDRILIVGDFESKEMSIPKSYLEGEFNDVIQNDFNGERDRFLAYLRNQDKTVRDFREELEDKIIVQSMQMRMRRNQAEISPEMIREFYQENQNRFLRDAEILLFQITLNPGPDRPGVEERSAAVMAALEEGTEFGEVAREFSDDGLADAGGKFGWTKEGDLRPELSRVVFDLEEGEVSDPVEFRGSVLFFYVAEVREPGPMPLAEVRDTIERILSDRISREAQERWLQRLREKAYIEYFI